MEELFLWKILEIKRIEININNIMWDINYWNTVANSVAPIKYKIAMNVKVL